jgi:poly(A) polymerase
MERVEALVGSHMRFMNVARMKESTLKRFLRMPDFAEHLELHRLDCLAGSGRLENYEFVRGKLAEYSAERLKPAPLLTGDDLIAAGYPPGPRFARILTAVEDAQLEGRIGTAEEAMSMVRGQFAVETSGQASTATTR